MEDNISLWMFRNPLLSLLLLLMPSVQADWTSSLMRPQYDDTPIEMSAAFTAASKRSADEREENGQLINSSDLIHSFGTTGWTSMRVEAEWLMTELPVVHQIWKIYMQQNLVEDEEPRNQRMLFLRTLYNHSQIHRENAYPNPDLSTWQTFYELEGPAYNQHINIHITNGQGVTRTLGIYCEHDQGMDFTAIQLYGYARLDLSEYSVSGKTAKHEPQACDDSHTYEKMIDGIAWEEENYYCNDGANEYNKYFYQSDRHVYFCDTCYPDKGPTSRMGAREVLFYYWTVVIANLHHPNDMHAEMILMDYDGFRILRDQHLAYDRDGDLSSVEGGLLIANLKAATARVLHLYSTGSNMSIIEELYIFGSRLDRVDLCVNGSVPNDTYFVSGPADDDVSYDDLWCMPEKSSKNVNWSWQVTPYPLWVYYNIGEINRILHITYFIVMSNSNYMEEYTHSVIMLSIEKQPSPISLNSSQWILVHNSTPFEDPETAPKHFTEALSSRGDTYRYAGLPLTASIDPPKLARYAGLHTDYMPEVYNHPENGSVYNVYMFTFDIIIQGKDNLCGFKPGSEHLRQAAERYNKSKPGDSLILHCDSEVWHELGQEETVSVFCVWMNNTMDDEYPQLYWNTTDFQRDFCIGSYYILSSADNSLS